MAFAAGVGAGCGSRGALPGRTAGVSTTTPTTSVPTVAPPPSRTVFAGTADVMERISGIEHTYSFTYAFGYVTPAAVVDPPDASGATSVEVRTAATVSYVDQTAGGPIPARQVAVAALLPSSSTLCRTLPGSSQPVGSPVDAGHCAVTLSASSGVESGDPPTYRPATRAGFDARTSTVTVGPVPYADAPVVAGELQHPDGYLLSAATTSQLQAPSGADAPTCLQGQLVVATTIPGLCPAGG